MHIFKNGTHARFPVAAVSCWVWAAQKTRGHVQCVCLYFSHLLHRLWALFWHFVFVYVFECVSEWVLGGVSMQHLGQRSAIDRKWSRGTATSAWQLIKWRDENGKTWGRGTCGLGWGVGGVSCYAIGKGWKTTAVQIQSDNVSVQFTGTLYLNMTKSNRQVMNIIYNE